MGFDVEKIYLLRSAIEQIKDDENCVYWNGKRQAEKGIQMFSFPYLPEDGDGTYNIVNDSDKFMLKLEK